MRLIAILFVTLFGFGSLLADSKEVEYGESGFSISINNIDAIIVREDSRIHVKIDGSSDVFMSSYTVLDLPEFRFLSALPRKGEAKAAITGYKMKYIGNVKISNSQYLSLDYIKDFKPEFDKESRLKPFVRMEDAGIMRGIRAGLVKLQPFDYNPASGDLYVLDSVQIQVSFSKSIPVSKVEDANKEVSFYSDMENFAHIPFLLGEFEMNHDKMQDRTLSKDSWYKPNIKYAKITTKKDGIAFISAERIIEAEQSFANKNLSGLHLLYRGSEVPIAITNDNDGLLNTGDRIIFLGKHPVGDTTWFNSFTTETAFYLYHDETSMGLRYSEFPQSSSSVPIEKARIDLHLEQDKFYTWGIDYANSNTVPGENWFWHLITAEKIGNPNNRKAKIPLMLMPAHNPGEKLKLTVHIESTGWDFDAYPAKERHFFKILFNGDTINQQRMNKYERRDVSLEIDQSAIFKGLNDLDFYTAGLYDNNNRLLDDQVGIDYLRLEGTIAPYAVNGTADLLIDKPGSDKFLGISNFRSSNIAFLDPDNKYISFRPAESGTFITGGVKSGDKPFSSFTYGDSSYTGYEKGIHIFTLRSPYKDYQVQKYNEPGTEAVNYIKSQPDGTIFIVLSNSNTVPGNDFNNMISDFGSTKIKNISQAYAWSFTLMKGRNSTFTEAINNSDISTISAFYPHNDGMSFKSGISLQGSKDYRILAAGDRDWDMASAYSVTSTELRKADNRIDYILITHKNFKDASKKLIEHRQKIDPDLKFMIVDVDEVYKEFNYGDKSTEAIKDFLKYAYSNWARPAPKYVLLMGDANMDARNYKPESANIDFIPTYGVPVSDFWYSKLEGDDNSAEIVIGRIPARTETEADNYVNKVIEHDTTDNAPWMKRFLFLAGGQDDEERRRFRKRMDDLAFDHFYESNYQICIDTIIIGRGKHDGSTVSETEAPMIKKEINEGTQWTTYLGHAAAVILEMDGWQVEKLNNNGKYGYLSMLSCNTGAFADERGTSRNEDYLMYPGKGFVGVGGSTFAGEATADIFMQTYIIQQIGKRDPNYWSYAELLTKSKSRFGTDGFEALTANQFTYLGDPMVKMRLSLDPDVYIRESDVAISGRDGQNTLLASDDSAFIRGSVYNAGFRINQHIETRLIHEYLGTADTQYVNLQGICQVSPFFYRSEIKNKPGTHRFSFEIDPDSLINDPVRKNNNVVIILEVFNEGMLALDPLPYWNVNYSDPVFRFINPIIDTGGFRYHFSIFKEIDTTYQLITESAQAEIEVKENYIEWKPGFILEKNKNYKVVAYYEILEDQTKSSSLEVSFNTFETVTKDSVKWNMTGYNNQLSNKTRQMKLSTEGVNPGFSIFDEKYPFRVVGTYSDPRYENWRYMLIYYNDKIYAEATNVFTAEIGTHVLVISKDSLKVKDYRWFQTNIDYRTNDSASIYMVRFLRDTVETGDYLLLTTCNYAFRLPFEVKFPPSEGSMDTLRKVLKLYGSTIADSLVPKSSYVMFGWKGAPEGSAIESNDTTGYQTEISGFLTDFRPEGEYATPLIGPAAKWENTFLQGMFPATGVDYTIDIMGYNNLKTNETLLNSIDSPQLIDISSIDAVKYPYLSLKYKFKRHAPEDNIKIEGQHASFVPVPELAVQRSSFVIKEDTLLRGEFAEIGFGFENISNRVSSSNTNLQLKVTSGSLEKYKESIPALPVESNKSVIFNKILETDNYDNVNRVEISLDEFRVNNELYLFNNKLNKKLYIEEDTVLPYAVLKLDSVEVKDGDFVSVRPWVEIDLYDKSPQIISDSTKISIRINSVFQNQAKFSFRSTGRSTPLKAVVSFLSDSLYYEDNYFEIYAEDPSGNRDTMRVKVFVSQNGIIENLRNAPNPVVNTTSIMFDYRAPLHGAFSRVEIHNLSGQKIRSLEKIINIGENIIEWNGLDDFGNKVAQGAYYYKLQVDGDIFVEPVFGKMIVTGE